MQDTVRVVRILRGHKGPITGLGLYVSSGGAVGDIQLISASEDGFIRIWRAATRDEMGVGEYQDMSPRSDRGITSIPYKLCIFCNR